MTENEVENFIRDAFEENFELLRLEAGYSITSDVKEAALQQVLLYWQKLRVIALKVTETEVKLTLPGQITSVGRKYSIEGVVDIIREEGSVWMYDIKTHDGDYVRSNIAMYEQQLNIYAHIWQTLRGQSLDGTAVIATAPTDDLRFALRSGDAAKIGKAVIRWEPLVPIPLDPGKLAETVNDFGCVVDQIENREFTPASLDKLKAPASKHKKIPFGTEVCRNCDARFSCASYRQFALANLTKSDAAIKYFLDDYGFDQDRAEWLDANLGALPSQLAEP